jgi:o-succinylbenzoate synthase
MTMIIEQIRLYHLSMPLVAPFETSFGRINERECVLVEISAGGLYGYGECVADRDPGYAFETTGTVWHILQEFLLPQLVGKAAVAPQALARLFVAVKGHPMAKAGVEMALWDLQGKASGRSLKAMLGGEKERVDVGVSIGLQPSTDELLRVVEDYLAGGYRRVKLKIKPGQDVAVTQAVRARFPELKLQVDANSAYTLDTAHALLLLDDLNLLLIEQPLAEDDLWDHHRLQAEFKTPLCLDESITSARHARQALEMDACRVINIKSGRVGGLNQSLAIHDLCLERGVPVWCGGMLETGVGRAANLALASLPGFSLPGDISATNRYYVEDVTRERFTLNPDSTIDVPDGIGLGVELDHQALARYTRASLTLG